MLTFQRCCRDEALAAWQRAPAARECHPREEHLLPLHVCAGAAGQDRGQAVYEGVCMGVHVASYVFGNWPAWICGEERLNAVVAGSGHKSRWIGSEPSQTP
jgi:hypothetical protein